MHGKLTFSLGLIAGSPAEHTTPSRCCTATDGTGLLSRSWHVPLQFTALHWVVADARLAKALLGYPLLVTALRHEPCRGQERSSRHSSSRPSEDNAGASRAGAMVVDVPIGSAEVDLSPLLLMRPGTKQPDSR